jgi:hypothetical protein
MNVRTVLDADMATVATWVRDGFDQWVDELRSLMPAWLSTRSNRHGPTIEWDGNDDFEVCRDGDTGVENDRSVLINPVVRLPQQLCLARTVPMPAVNARDMRTLLAFEAERILPLSGGELIVAGAPAGLPGENGIVATRVAGIGRPQAERLCAAISRTGLNPSAIVLSDPVAPINFLPVLRENGLIARRGNASQIWWALVVFGLLLNIGLLVWRDTASVEQVRQLVDAQKPAAIAAQRSAARMQSTVRKAALAANRREDYNALVTLAAVSRALPNGAWVQRYIWDGRSLRITGYKSRGVDPLAVLRESGLFVDVRSANSDVLAEIPAGQPFDIAARIGEH